MATYRNAHDLATAQRRRAQKVKRSLEIAGQSMVNDMKAEAIRLTSGTASEEQLRREGYPYARNRTRSRRRGGQRGTRPRLPINAQTKELQKSLRIFRRMSARGISWQLQFTSRHAIVLTPGGLQHMVARGFWAAMNKFYQTKAKRRLLQAWRMAHK